MSNTEGFIPAKRGQFWQFPIQTGSQLEGGKNYMVEHCHNGLAMAGREGEIAEFGGWHRSQACVLVGEVNWSEGDKIFPSNQLEFFVLRGRLIMN
jgi:hypothetical protein